ncbi:MAG: hypothetical protein V4650_07255 [Pseudomonadota bacterium]
MGALKPWTQPGRKRRRLLFLLLALLIPACAYLRAAPEAVLANAELEELSGLTRSLATDDWLWAHNDSGDSARLFRVGGDGSDGGVVEVPDTLAIDWEDIATLRWQGQPALLIGDIGDNAAKRAAITLYAVRDPGAKGGSAPLLWQLNVRYPDGPRDAEGLAVDPLTGDILILSKRERPPVVYRVALPDAPPKPGAVVVAEKLGPVLHLPKPNALDLSEDPLYGLLRDWPTAFDIAPDGLSAIVTTYKDAHRYRRLAGESWAQAFAQMPERIDLPQWKQTEAGGLTADGLRFCAGSEQRAGFACMTLPVMP